MLDATLIQTAVIAGETITSRIDRSAEGNVNLKVDLPAADAGALTTRTNDTDGTLTMDDAGHGITTGSKIDIFWAGGCAYGATVGTVSGTSVPFTGATGDALPADETDVTADVQVVCNAAFDGDDAQAVVAKSTRDGHCCFVIGAGTVLKAVDLAEAEPWQWVADTGITNPLSGAAIATVKISNGDAANAAVFQLGVLYDSTP